MPATLTVTRVGDLREGDRIIAAGGTQIDPRTVTDIRDGNVHTTPPEGRESVLDWVIYGEHVTDAHGGLTVERRDPYEPRTAADYTVGDHVFVYADQGIRHGTVTKIGRTRITVRHPRNLRGDMVERPYTMGAVIVGQCRSYGAWAMVFASGHVYGTREMRKHPELPTIPSDWDGYRESPPA